MTDNMSILRLGVLTSHPIQYQAPLFRELANHVDLQVYFAHRVSPKDQAKAGFDVAFEWDIDLFGGYANQFLDNVAKNRDAYYFFRYDTPTIGDKIRREQFDAFLVMGWHLKSYWQAIRACRRYGVPLLVRGDSHLSTARGAIKRFVKNIGYPLLLSQFDACLYVGEKNREYLVHYGVPADRLFFSPHCVDNDAFESRARAVDRDRSRKDLCIARDARAVLFVGKLLEGKRPLDVVQAVRVLRDQGIDACCVFAGDGPLRHVLEAKAFEWCVPVIFLGFRNQTQLPEAYVLADVLVLPLQLAKPGDSWLTRRLLAVPPS